MKSRKVNLRKLLLIFIGIGLIISVLIFCISKLNKVKLEEAHVVVSDTIIPYEEVGSYGDGLISVLDDSKVGFIDENGNVVIDFKYDSNSLYSVFEHGYTVVSLDDVYRVINKNGEEIISGDYDYITQYNDTFLVTKDSKTGLLDKLGNFIIPMEYEYINSYSFYLAAVDGSVVDVYDKKGNIILEDVELLRFGAYDSYTLNDKFIVTVEDNGAKRIYFIDSKIYLEDTYNFISISENRAIARGDDKTVIYDEKGNIVKTLNTIYDDYFAVSVDSIAVSKSDCEVDSESQNSHYNLYDYDGNKITNGCYYIYEYNDITILTDADQKNLKLYKGNELLFEKKSDDNIYAAVNDYGNIIISNSKNDLLYNQDGTQILSKCSEVSQLSDDLYLCEATANIGYISNLEGDFKDSKVVYDTSNYEEYTEIKYATGGSKVLDLFGNTVLETDEKINMIHARGSLLIFEVNDAIYFRKISYVTDKEIEAEDLETDVTFSLEKNTIDYDSINVDEVIKEYSLDNIKELILDNETLFQQFAYHVINNETLSTKHKGTIFNLFGEVVEFAKYNKLDKLFNKIDTLSIQLPETRPADMQEWAAGIYSSFENKIVILPQYEDYAIDHELTHFISFAREGEYDKYSSMIYYCSSKYVSAEEVINYDDFDLQRKCEAKYSYTNNFFEETGAEYFSTYYYNSKLYEAYYDSVLAYNILKYALGGVDFTSIEFSPYRDYEFYKIVNDKLKYDFEQIEELYQKLEKIIQIEQSYVTNTNEIAYSHYTLVDSLIDVYSITHTGDWMEDEFFVSAVERFIRNHDIASAKRYTDSNEDKTIKYYNEYLSLEYDNIIEYRLDEYQDNKGIVSSANYISDDKNNKIIFNYFDSNYNIKKAILYYSKTGQFEKIEEESE